LTNGTRLAAKKMIRAGGLKMSSTLDFAARLRQRFNHLPEKTASGNSSIDEELYVNILNKPGLELALSINPDNTADPERAYKHIISELSKALFEPSDIQKIITAYVKGNQWEKWSEGEKGLFIHENVEQFEAKEDEQIEKTESIDELDTALDQVTGHKTGDFEREIGERQQIKDILNSVSKVEIVTGITNKDPGYWRFYISSNVFEIPAASLVKHDEFEIMYFTKFGDYLPAMLTTTKRGVKETPWRAFVKALRIRAVMVDPMESTELIEIGIIIDEIASEYQPTTDPVEWIKGSHVMLEVKGEFYLITPKKMKELAEDLHIKTELGELSDIMSQRGMKRPNNPTKSIPGKKLRAWWFKKDLIDAHKNSDTGDDDE